MHSYFKMCYKNYYCLSPNTEMMVLNAVGCVAYPALVALQLAHCVHYRGELVIFPQGVVRRAEADMIS